MKITPSQQALCVKLAQRNHAAGFLLYLIVYWHQYAKPTIPKFKGKWIANKREWWMLQGQLTPSQLDRALPFLKRLRLIERTQYWFGRENILHVRPTELTTNYLTAAKTWQAAEELYPASETTGATEAKSAKPGSSKTTSSKGFIIAAKLGSAELVKSNTIKTSHLNKPTNHSSAQTASPPCSKGGEAVSGKISGKKEKGAKTKNCIVPKPLSTQKAAPKITFVLAAWNACYALHHPGDPLDPWTPKQIGAIALATEALAHTDGPSGLEDLRHRACDIFAFAAQHWSKLGMIKPRPEPTHPFELSTILGVWNNAGRPSFTVEALQPANP